ncbi:NADPH-dependent FMN reductase [Microbulbifer hainanensis]|uniref:NADPH-dependent FMN reductase n=1 Tax=Microbulbifer hainanensis TaxID=2735675 RepID=UPI001869469F|nr:NADPH-dependent FMN reductase [Microbulbifer hainanensis]
MRSTKILALSGSLRAASYNTAAIQALKILAPSNIDVAIGSIGDLPLFNPDREGEHIPSLAALTDSLKNSDGLVIASPEYAHGISGPMKNALDWLVSGTEFPYKPIMLINTSPRASHAQASIREVIKTMSGIVVDKACVTIPLLSSDLDAAGIVENKDISDALKLGLNALCAEIEAQKLSSLAN